jgi:hypothetical protein
MVHGSNLVEDSRAAVTLGRCLAPWSSPQSVGSGFSWVGGSGLIVCLSGSRLEV